MKYVDNFLNRITMYKLVLYGLMILCFISLVLSALSILPYSVISLIESFLAITVVCYLSNAIFAKLFKVETNVESASISSFILFLLLLPLSSLLDLWFFVLAGVVAMASKYFLAIRKKHIFNPSAFSLVVIGLCGSGLGLWWVGSTVMLIPTAILGFLVLRKVKRFTMFGVFLASSLLSMSIFAFFQGMSLYDVLSQAFLSGPIIFLGTIMLTEPFTTPPQKYSQIIYAIIVGLLYGSQFHIGPLYSTPALALVIANIFSYIVSPKDRLVLSLIEKKKLSPDVYDFTWKIQNNRSDKLNFKAGQYLEWTLGHKSPDIRGNRRYFTIASSPTESDLHLGVKFYDKGSSFKKVLNTLPLDSTISAGQLAGDFILPKDANKKLVFIAGGIGVTPFRSMVKYMIDKKEQRSVTMLFSNKTPADIVYKDLFDEAHAEVGMNTVYVVNDLAGAEKRNDMRVGMITGDMIMQEVPDYKDRMFYISGPRAMTDAFKNTLQKLGIKRSQIMTDFFPGFV